MKNNLYKYSQRRKDLENICLADFCSLYIKKRKDAEGKDNSDDDNDLVDKLNKRKMPSVIRYRHYKLMQDPYNYYREQIVLFFPGRNEFEEVEKSDCEKIYFEHLEEIEKNSNKFSIIGDETLEMAMKAIEHEICDLHEEEIKEFDKNAVSNEQKVDIFQQSGKNDRQKSAR